MAPTYAAPGLLMVISTDLEPNRLKWLFQLFRSSMVSCID